jgi:hypothetical protein
MTTLKIENNKVMINGEKYTVENHNPEKIDPVKVLEHLDTDEFVGVWFVKDCQGYVFHSKNPDRSKSHKDYCIVKYRYNAMTEKYDMVIMGYDTDDMNKMSTQGAVACHHCKTVIWSLHRHDYHYCKCLPNETDRVGKENILSEEEITKLRKQACSIDGGMDYMRGSPGSDCTYMSINHLTKEIILSEEKGEENVG